jgi:hypothetical protein
MFAFEEGYAGVTGDKYKPGGVLETMWNSSLIGTSSSVTSEINNYVEKGCTAFELKFIYDNVDQMIEQWHDFSDNVMPSFQ